MDLLGQLQEPPIFGNFAIYAMSFTVQFFFLTPTPIALAGIILMTLCLSSTYLWLSKDKNSLGDTAYTDQVQSLVIVWL